MEDFLRFNLNVFLGAVISLVIVLVMHFMILKGIPKDKKSERKTIRYVFIFLYVLILAGIVGTVIRQLSVNAIPRSNVDRSYTQETQDSYQNRVLENSKKEVQK